MADRVGEQLGNYRLLRLLGQGGFAEVYLGKQAAIKVLHTKLGSADMESFRLEARRVSSLEHPISLAFWILASKGPRLFWL